MGLNSFRRVEKKFLIDKCKYELLLPSLLEYMDYDAHCENGKMYTIYNIYFDTDDNNLIRHSLMKPIFKEKLRLRSYQESANMNDLVYLEIKRKHNKVVTKRRCELTVSEAISLINDGIVPKRDDYSSRQILSEISYFLQIYNVTPKVYISYDRVALFSKDDPNTRLTIDHNIITRRDDLRLESVSHGSEILGENNYLMEIKIEGAMPLWLSSLLTKYEIYPISYSKYGNEYKKEVLSA